MLDTDPATLSRACLCTGEEIMDIPRSDEEHPVAVKPEHSRFLGKEH
jgi:hypothetical protein